MQAWILTSPASHLFNLLDLCKLQFITNGAFIHWSISSESDLATRNGFSLFIWVIVPVSRGRCTEIDVWVNISDVDPTCSTLYLLCTELPLSVDNQLFFWNRVLLPFQRETLWFRSRSVDKGWIFWSGVKLVDLNWFHIVLCYL